MTSLFFFFNDTATTEIYTLSLHDALPISDLPNVPSVTAAVFATRAAQQQADSYKLALLPSFAGTITQYNTNAPSFEPSRWYYQAAITPSWTFDLTYVANIRTYNAGAAAATATA